MTDIQVRYWEYVEGKRHNVETEGLTRGYNQEIVRHNTQTEILGFQTLSETQRHNLVQEDIGQQQARASLTMASASVVQAQAASSQAASAAMRAQADVALTTSKTTYQNTSNWIQNQQKYPQVIGSWVGIVTDVFKIAGTAAALI